VSSQLKHWIAWSSASVAVGLLIRVVMQRVSGHVPERTVFTDALQGTIAGAVLAYVTANLIIEAKLRAIQTRVNGWRTTLKHRKRGSGILLRAALAKDIAALNVPEEQVYWETFVDGAGDRLSGRRRYILRFPPGGLPPNDAWWSLTLGDASRRMVENPLRRYSVGAGSGLAANADGSIDIYIQRAAPDVHVSNWLPAPSGAFMLWLRVYQPAAAILDGTYGVPPVIAVKP
jgi:hypothetical protein